MEFSRSRWKTYTKWVQWCSWGWHSPQCKVIILSALNKLPCKKLILFINFNSLMEKLAFGLVQNAKHFELPEENCKVTWDRLINKCALHTASSLLQLKWNFHNSKLKSIKKDPNEWIANLEELRIQMNWFGSKGCISNKDFMIHVLNNFHKEYKIILDGKSS